MGHKTVGGSAQSEAQNFKKATDEHRLPRQDQVKICQN